ncbi:MAG: cytochrome C [Methylococcaceae bacterium]|nr:cytochrome C [Methylococcaceae bacterium]
MAGLSAVLLVPAAHAVPSFSRQTGASCNMCHTNSFGPNLTPYGRDFKLRGYSDGENASGLPPLSGMIMGSFTNTQKGQDPQVMGGQRYSRNNNFTLDQASLFYGGRIWDKLGALSQLTYDGLEDRIALDNTDIRYARDQELAGLDLVYGVSLNNSPTVQDLWNTTPAWGFPYAGSPLAPAPGAAPLIDGGLGATQVGGATFYTMINQWLYVEGGAYTTFARNFQQAMGAWSPDQAVIDGGAPYWRFALQHDFGGHYVSVGHYGLRANVFPGGDRSAGTDRYTDLAFDATYQYLGNLEHIFELKTTYIREGQELFASRRLGVTALSDNQLNAFKINGAYTYDQTYSLNLGYNRTTGTRNLGLYAPPDYAVSARPDSEYFTAELDYVPFGKSTSPLQPWLNLRLGLQYVAYNKFNGTAHHAGEANTLLLNGWLAF